MYPTSAVNSLLEVEKKFLYLDKLVLLSVNELPLLHKQLPKTTLKIVKILSENMPKKEKCTTKTHKTLEFEASKHQRHEDGWSAVNI